MPRIWGRSYAEDGTYTWEKVETNSYETFDYGYVTQLIQVLKLSLGESPFYANYGIPAQKSVMTQIFPDIFVTQTQQQFSPYFATLLVGKEQNSATPIYNVNITFFNGTKYNTQVLV
jgi:hypothetical protein